MLDRCGTGNLSIRAYPGSSTTSTTSTTGLEIVLKSQAVTYLPYRLVRGTLDTLPQPQVLIVTGLPRYLYNSILCNLPFVQSPASAPSHARALDYCRGTVLCSFVHGIISGDVLRTEYG